jgi:hypothetical protein
MRSTTSFRFAGALLAVLVGSHPSFGGAAQSEVRQPSSGRTVVVALEVDRDGARLIGFTVKDRPFGTRQGISVNGADMDGKTRIEVALLGPAGARFTQHVAVGGLCLAHDPDTPAEVAGDTIRLHRESILVEVPEIDGFDRLELGYDAGPAAARVAIVAGPLKLDAAHFMQAGGTLRYEDLSFAHGSAPAAASPLTAGTLHFPEEYHDDDIFTVYGDAAETAKRINIVIVPDGYTYAQKDMMQAHAQALVSSFRNKTPFKEHDRFVNYILVYAYSTESGTDQCDCSIVKDTAMSTRFVTTTPTCGHSDNRCLYYGSGCDTNTSSHIATTELRAPADDATIVMVDTTRYGGCGGARAVYSAANTSATEIAIHELGHSLAGLADEYGGTPSCGSGGGINVSMDRSNGSWPEWVPEIGAPWEGAQYYEQCIYRPMSNCEMRALGVPFCPVCLQQWALTFFGHPRVVSTAPIQSSTPGSSVIADMVTPQSFSLVTRLATGPGVTNDITWQLQGPGFPTPTTVASGTESYTRTFNTQGTFTLTSRLVADTNFVKPSKNAGNVDAVSWTVKVCDLSGEAPSANNGPLCAGASLQLTAANVPGATYAWTGPNGFQSNVQNPTIAGADASASGDYTVTITSPACQFSSTTSVLVVAEGNVCEDGNLCSQPDICQAASCVSGPIVNCDDGNICTIDACVTSGCSHAPVTCNATDACHPVGSCSVVTGTCSYPVRDQDGDGHGAAVCGADDCNDSNAQVWLVPIEVANVRAAGKSQTTLSWDDQRPVVGPATTYNLVSGTLGGFFPYETSACLSTNTGGISFVDTRGAPSPGQVYWYLSRARNACGAGTYGSAVADDLMNPCP